MAESMNCKTRSAANLLTYFQVPNPPLAGAQAPPQDPVRQRAPKVAVRALHVERGVQQGGE